MAATGAGEPRVKMLLAPASVGKHNKQLHDRAARLAFLWGKTKRLSSPCGLSGLVKSQEKALSLSQVLCQPKKFSLQHISHAWQSFWQGFSSGKEAGLSCRAGSRGCPCLCPGVWRAPSAPSPGTADPELPHPKRTVSRMPHPADTEGWPMPHKPSFQVTGAPRVAVCKALSPFHF